METVSDRNAAQRYNEIEVNKLDITVPSSKTEELGKKREGKEGWKTRQEALENRHSNRTKRPGGYGFKKDDPGA